MTHLKLSAIVPGSEEYAIEFCWDLGGDDNLIRRPISRKKIGIDKKIILW